MGFEVTPVSSLEWSELTADDILVLIYPLQRVEPARLGAFIQAGGNAVIADDFGDGKDAMAGARPAARGGHHAARRASTPTISCGRRSPRRGASTRSRSTSATSSPTTPPRYRISRARRW